MEDCLDLWMPQLHAGSLLLPTLSLSRGGLHCPFVLFSSFTSMTWSRLSVSLSDDLPNGYTNGHHSQDVKENSSSKDSVHSTSTCPVLTIPGISTMTTKATNNMVLSSTNSDTPAMTTRISSTVTTDTV